MKCNPAMAGQMDFLRSRQGLVGQPFGVQGGKTLLLDDKGLDDVIRKNALNGQRNPMNSHMNV